MSHEAHPYLGSIMFPETEVAGLSRKSMNIVSCFLTDCVGCARMSQDHERVS